MLSRLIKKIFNRNLMIFIILLVQAFFILAVFFKLREYSTVIYGAQTVVSFLLVCYVTNREETNPAYKLSWAIIIMLLPIVGASLYIFLHAQLGTMFFNEKKNRMIKLTKQFIPQDPSVLQQLEEENIHSGHLAKYINDYGGYPVYKNTYTKYFTVGEEKYAAMIEELEKAEKFIFIEYFIIDEGEMLDTILEILERKAKQGVEIRLLYDGMGTEIHRSGKFKKNIASKGIQCRVFNEFRPFLSSVQNNRDHRKILVIDGNTAFTGGINLADEYINKIERFGHWKDTAIMIKGEAVWSFTIMFIQMWDFKTKQTDDLKKYMPDIKANELPYSENGYIQPYGDTPTDNELTGELVYMNIINKARDYIYITTPYLIVDNEMITALTFAAKSGIDVKIIVPHIPDKGYVNILAWNYYQELIKYGVQIYEYMPGFIHAKSFVSDDETAVVGTINMDYRSFYLHFECAAVMYNTPIISDIKLDFLNTLAKSRLITMKDCTSRSLVKKLAGGFLRLIAPLL
ncbi:MAG: cardiolipin synthase [Ruminococcus sp.]|nr:cardiolipin synthase [Ruminococcus sp.]